MDDNRIMEAPTLRTDLELARDASDANEARRVRAARDLYALHGARLAAFLRRRVPDPGPRDPVREFWTRLFSGHALARYDGTVPLAAFLLEEAEGWVAAFRRGDGRPRREDPEVLRRLYGGEASMSLENRALARAASRALVLLSETWPEDADLVRARLLGLSFEDEARRRLSGEAADNEAETLGRDLETRFNRPGTGAWAKFSILLDRCMETPDETGRETSSQGGPP